MKILRSHDYGSYLVFAVLKLNRSCYILLAAQNMYYRLQTLNLTIICVTDSRVNWKIIQVKRFTSSSEVAKPTFSTRNCLQRSLIGKHSNCIVRPLEVILKETNSHFEEKEPHYDCTLASTECDAVLLNLLHNTKRLGPFLGFGCNFGEKQNKCLKMDRKSVCLM